MARAFHSDLDERPNNVRSMAPRLRPKSATAPPVQLHADTRPVRDLDLATLRRRLEDLEGTPLSVARKVLASELRHRMKQDERLSTRAAR